LFCFSSDAVTLGDEKPQNEPDEFAGRLDETFFKAVDSYTEDPEPLEEVLNASEKFFENDIAAQASKPKVSSDTLPYYYTQAEKAELEELFKTFIDAKRRPTPANVRKKLEQSKANKGQLHKRGFSSVKNKILRLIDQLTEIG
jgi:hypothetical protein